MSGNTAKQVDDHRHDVELDTGTTVQTGPPITAEGAPDEAEELSADLGLVEAPQERRASGCPCAGKKSATVPRSVKLAEELQAEAEGSTKAIKTGNPAALPPQARKVWERMFKSARRFLETQGEKDDRYCAALGWLGVRQKYALPGAKSAGANVSLGVRTPVVTRSKGTFANTVQGVSGGAWIVNLAGDKNADVLYERTESIPLPSAQGASVLVGLGPGNHRNILTVSIPTRMVSEQAGAAGPIKWVNNHQDEIYRVAKGSHRYLLTREDRTKRGVVPVQRVVQFKGFGGRGPMFTADPSQASKRIAYGENYVPFEIDLQGEYATEEEIENFAHGFLKSLMQGSASPGEMHSRWLMPDGSPAGVPVESFLVRRGDPDFEIEGSWVVGTEYHPDVWKRIESGEYRGYSIGGRWGTTPIERRAS